MTILARADTADFRALFEAHAGYVWASLRRLGVAQSDLEDLTHEVFLQVHRRLADYDVSRPARPWLFAFALRIASQHRREKARRREVALERPEHAVSNAPRADERISLEQDRRLVLEALSSIDLDQRAVFVMADLDEVSMPDIAAALEIPLNTGYSRLRLARAEFTAAIKRLRARGEVRVKNPIGWTTKSPSCWRANARSRPRPTRSSACGSASPCSHRQEAVVSRAASRREARPDSRACCWRRRLAEALRSARPSRSDCGHPSSASSTSIARSPCRLPATLRRFQRVRPLPWFRLRQ